MSDPTNKHNALWNELPYEERHRLMPHMIETQKLHIWQCKQKAILAHKSHLKVLDDWMANLDASLKQLEKEIAP